MSDPLRFLYRIESRVLSKLLIEENRWHRVSCRYPNYPRVERLWRQIGRYRISLNRVFPVSAGEMIILHSHNRPLAMHILAPAGQGKFSLSHQKLCLSGNEDDRSHRLTYECVSHGRFPNERVYFLSGHGTFHSVLACGEPLYFLLVTGPRFANCLADGQEKVIDELPLDKAMEIFQFFRNRYP